jgi:hypothetical protein
MRLGNMRYAVTVISIAYDLTWLSRSASHGNTRTRQASPITRTPSISGCAFLAGETVLAARSFAARSIDSRGGDQRWDRAAIITRRLFTVASATSQPVQRVGPSINVAALPNPPDEASDIAASLQLLGLGERHPAS